MEAAIRSHALYRKAGPVRFFARAAFDTAVAAIRRLPVASDFDDPRFPSHLHINVLPAYRGRGVGQALMVAWLAGQAAAGHVARLLPKLGTLLENESAQRFFARCGFVRVGEPALVPGIRYRGRLVHQIIMAQEFETQLS